MDSDGQDQTNALFIILMNIIDILHERVLRLNSSENYELLDSLSRKQAKALFIVALNNGVSPEGMSLKSLASELGLTTPATSILVETLVRKGALSRNVSSKDRRAICIKLTDFGVQVHNSLHQNMLRFSQHLMEGLTEREKKIFRDVINHFQKRSLKYNPFEPE